MRETEQSRHRPETGSRDRLEVGKDTGYAVTDKRDRSPTGWGTFSLEIGHDLSRDRKWGCRLLSLFWTVMLPLAESWLSTLSLSSFFSFVQERKSVKRFSVCSRCCAWNSTKRSSIQQLYRYAYDWSVFVLFCFFSRCTWLLNHFLHCNVDLHPNHISISVILVTSPHK